MTWARPRWDHPIVASSVLPAAELARPRSGARTMHHHQLPPQPPLHQRPTVSPPTRLPRRICTRRETCHPVAEWELVPSSWFGTRDRHGVPHCFFVPWPNPLPLKPRLATQPASSPSPRSLIEFFLLDASSTKICPFNICISPYPRPTKVACALRRRRLNTRLFDAKISTQKQHVSSLLT